MLRQVDGVVETRRFSTIFMEKNYSFMLVFNTNAKGKFYENEVIHILAVPTNLIELMSRMIFDDTIS